MANMASHLCAALRQWQEQCYLPPMLETIFSMLEQLHRLFPGARTPWTPCSRRTRTACHQRSQVTKRCVLCPMARVLWLLELLCPVLASQAMPSTVGSDF